MAIVTMLCLRLLVFLLLAPRFLNAAPKSRPICKASYGMNIKPQDCKEYVPIPECPDLPRTGLWGVRHALRESRNNSLSFINIVSVKEIPVNLRTISRVLEDFKLKTRYFINDRHNTLYLFGRRSTLVDRQHVLPQGFVSGSCAIGVDLPSHTPDSRLSSWSVQADGIETLINTCVEPLGVGGSFVHRELEFIITNPAAGITEGTCLAPPPSPGLPLGRCIEVRVQAMEKIAQRGQIIQTFLSAAGPASMAPNSALAQSHDQLRPFLSRLAPPSVAPTAVTQQNPDQYRLVLSGLAAASTAQDAASLQNQGQVRPLIPAAGGPQSPGSAFTPYRRPASPSLQHLPSLPAPNSSSEELSAPRAT